MAPPGDDPQVPEIGLRNAAPGDARQAGPRTLRLGDGARYQITVAIGGHCWLEVQPDYQPHDTDVRADPHRVTIATAVEIADAAGGLGDTLIETVQESCAIGGLQRVNRRTSPPTGGLSGSTTP